jgi:hypothetical protein
MKLAIAAVGAVVLLTVIGRPGVDATDITIAGPGCYDDGIVVSYETAPVQPGFAVPTAVLTGVAPRCGGAHVSVSLYQDGAEPMLVASGTVTIPTEVNGPVTVPLDLVEQAERVDRIRLLINGGGLPVPPECVTMRFDAVLEVGDGALLLVGTPRRDLLLGRSGDETIRGRAGRDCVVGGDGHDLLQGDEGDDVLLGRDGDDVLEGGNGHDQLVGGSGNDVLRDVDGRHGDETGHDILLGGDGDDVLEAGAGNDLLVGGPGFDRFDGGRGRDVCVAEPGEPVRNCEVVIR